MIVNSTFHYEGKNTTFVDLERESEDCEEIFAGLGFKIFSFVLWLMINSFSNVYQFCIILFEMFGGDPLKRSIVNQLLSQLSFAMILHNITYRQDRQ